LSTTTSAAATAISGDDAIAWRIAQHDGGAVQPGAAAAPALVVGHVGHVRTIALAGVDDEEAGGPRRRKQGADRRQDRAQRRRVIALAGEIAVARQEIDLQVDRQQRRPRRLEPAVIGEIERAGLHGEVFGIGAILGLRV